MKRTPCSVGIA